MRQFTLTLAILVAAAVGANAADPQWTPKNAMGAKPPASLGSPSSALTSRKTESKGGLFGAGLLPNLRPIGSSSTSPGSRLLRTTSTSPSTATASNQKPFFQRLFGR